MKWVVIMAIRKIYDEEFFYQSILKEEREKVFEIINNKKEYYYDRIIAKKNGSRELKCIIKDSSLYFLQKNLVNYFLNNLPLPLYVYGFVKGYSYRNYLEPHLRKENEEMFYTRVDIKSFFDSINIELIKATFRSYFKFNNDILREELIDVFAEIVTLEGLLPQGAVTSPIISNLVFVKVDIRIHNYCKKLNITYTRYADDMLFSSKQDKVFKGYFMNMLTKILMENDYLINYSKTKKDVSKISLNGFVVSNFLSLSRLRKQDISKVIYIYDTIKPFDTAKYFNALNVKSNDFRYITFKDDCYFSSKGRLINYLSGYRAFLIDWLPNSDEEFRYKKAKRLIDKIQEIIIKIQE